MKSSLTARAASAALLITLATPSFAQALFFDGFDYPNGELSTVSVGAWTTLEANYAQTYQVSNGELLASYVSQSGSGVNREVVHTLGSPVTEGTVYTSMVLNASSLPATSAGYIAYLTSANSTSTRADRLSYHLLTGTEEIQFGIVNDSTASNATWFPATGSVGNDYLIVTRYDIATGTSTLWVNPVDESSTSVIYSAGTLLSTQGGVGGLGLRLRSNVNSGDYTLDDVRIGTSWLDVTGPVVAVPEPSTFLLTALGGALFLLARRRRR